MPGGDVSSDRLVAALGESFAVDDLFVEVDVVSVGDLGGLAVAKLDLHVASSAVRSGWRGLISMARLAVDEDQHADDPQFGPTSQWGKTATFRARRWRGPQLAVLIADLLRGAVKGSWSQR
ncbi:MAG: hypothetical protein WCF12_01730 [Propionicimonas sp.]